MCYCLNKWIILLKDTKHFLLAYFLLALWKILVLLASIPETNLTRKATKKVRIVNAKRLQKQVRQYTGLCIWRVENKLHEHVFFENPANDNCNNSSLKLKHF